MLHMNMDGYYKTAYLQILFVNITERSIRFGEIPPLIQYFKENKRLGEEIKFLLDDVAEKKPSSEGEYYYNIFKALLDSSSFTIDEREEITKALLDTKLMEKSSSALGLFDTVITSSSHVIDYLDKFPKNYTNLPLIILNENISEEDRIRILKKKFIQKDMHQYISIMRDKLKSFKALDSFIEATVVQNARVKEKDAAIENVLLRFFVGTQNEGRIKYERLLKISGLDEFYEKYNKKYLTAHELSYKYTSNRRTDLNENIKAYIKTIMLPHMNNDFSEIFRHILNKMTYSDPEKNREVISDMEDYFLQLFRNQLDYASNASDLLEYENQDELKLYLLILKNKVSNFTRIFNYYDNGFSYRKFDAIQFVNAYPEIFADKLLTAYPDHDYNTYGYDYYYGKNTAASAFTEFFIYNPGKSEILQKEYFKYLPLPTYKIESGFIDMAPYNRNGKKNGLTFLADFYYILENIMTSHPDYTETIYDVFVQPYENSEYTEKIFDGYISALKDERLSVYIDNSSKPTSFDIYYSSLMRLVNYISNSVDYGMLAIRENIKKLKTDVDFYTEFQ